MKVVIRKDTPPDPRRRGPEQCAFIEAASRMRPGEWFVIPDSDKMDSIKITSRQAALQTRFRMRNINAICRRATLDGKRHLIVLFHKRDRKF